MKKSLTCINPKIALNGFALLELLMEHCGIALQAQVAATSFLQPTIIKIIRSHPAELMAAEREVHGEASRLLVLWAQTFGRT